MEAQFEREKTALVHKIVGQSDWDALTITEPLSRIVGLDLPYNVKFKVVDIPSILHENVKERDNFSKVISALKILKKYGRNLQKPEELRPPMWHTIMYSNGVFKSSVDVIKGARDVLRTLGYKDESVHGLCFAKNTQPDQLTIAFVITELMIGLGEIEQYVNGQAANPGYLESVILPSARVPQQRHYYSSFADVPVVGKEVDLRAANAEGNNRTVTVIGQPEPCDICGNELTAVVCETCNSKWLCEECDQRYHGHRLRTNHVRSRISQDVLSPRRREPVESEETSESVGGVHSNQWSAADQRSNEMRHSAELAQRLSGIEVNSIQDITSGQLPDLSGVFSASNSAELLSAQKSLSAGNVVAINRPESTAAYPTELKMINPNQGIQDNNAFLSRIKTQPDKFNEFQRMLITDYRGPTCNLLNQIMAINPLEKQREVLDMCILKLQMGLVQGAALNMNQQLVRTQLMCLVRFRKQWEMLVQQKTEELNQNRMSGQSNSSENSSGNFTFVININSHMNQMQNQGINVSNTRTTFGSNPANSTNASFAGPAPVIPLHIEQPETSNFDQPAPPALPDVNTSLSYANKFGSPSHVCQMCQRLTRTNTQFCQHCGNRIEENLSVTQQPSKAEITSSPKSPLLWQCGHCTYRNHPDSLACDICQRVTDDPVWITEESVEDPFGLPPQKSDREDRDVEEIMQRQERGEPSPAKIQPNPGLPENEVPPMGNYGEIPGIESKPTIQQRRGESVMAPLTMNVTHTQRRSMMQETASGFIYNLVGGDMSQMSPGGSASPVPPESLPSILNSVKEDNKVQENQARQLVSKIRDAEINNYSLEEFEVALDRGSSDDPLSWLSSTWDKTIKEAKAVLEALTSELDKTKFFFTDMQIRAKLSSCHGDVDKATSELISERQQILEDLETLESFPEEEILQALRDCHGNKERVESHLADKVLLEFRSAIWEADPGINEELERVIRDKNTDSQRRGRLVLVEGFLKSWGRVETVLYLLDYAELDPSITLDDVIDAANECGHRAATLQYLQQECQICFSTCSRNKIMNLTHCQCQVCRPCMQEYFEVVIRERPVRDLVCPVCLLPDIQDPEQSQQHFQFLDLLLKGLVQDDTVELYQRKVRDWILMQDPQFRWCSHCDSGFLFHPEEGQDNLEMTCPQCSKQTCYKCQKPWEEQHAGLTCEQFTEWKIANDPEHQAQGLARHLQEYGIECPSCKFRYVLSRGGCMHFKCTQCQHEFCSGCYKPFKRQNCQFLRSCAHAGLHCHHPRDCLFYLRDYEFGELQMLLKESNIVYKEDKLDDTDHADESSTCPIVEQKETASGLIDEACGREVVPKHAGLCQLHYKEYLVGLVNKHNLDPVSIMTTGQLELQLKKYEKPNLKKKGKESEAAYRKRLITHVQNQVPLVTKSRKNYKSQH